MKIATWNVNSVRARLERLLKWLAAYRPDVLCLQELKGTEEQFPFEAVREAGYQAAVHGQKTYNGVAILARDEILDVRRGLEDGVEDPQARLISARVAGVRIISAYCPNGAEVGSEKYAYKLAWMRRLRDYLARRWDGAEPLALCGDFNVAPEARDVANPVAWEGTVLYNPEVRATLQEVLRVGLADTFRLLHPEGGHYSWWDYRMGAFPKNDGLRIDHIFASEPLARRCAGASIDRDERKGALPSDHAPVTATFSG